MNKDLFSLMNRWIICHFILQSMTVALFFFFFPRIVQGWHGEETLFYCWMLNEIHFHWKIIVCCFFFTMHPSNLDHKDMQRRGVSNISSGGIKWGRGGVKGHQMNRRGPGASRLVDDRVFFSIAFLTNKSLTPCEWAMCGLWHTPQGLR